jgi:ABC-2 type transport system ATP-binding protein
MTPLDSPPDAVIRINGLTRRFGATLALENVSLSVPRGTVFGIIGANGAGKTTLIKHVLGLYQPQAGSVSVFGRNPVADPVGVLSRVGYLSEDNDLPGWMRIEELLRYLQAFYHTWDENYAEELRQTFGLERRATIRNLSKGQRARVGLLAALAHRPELLVLDEPSSGLDPLARRDILGAVIRTVADEGRTVLFSSHLLDEVERVSDHVAVMSGGKILECAGLDEIKERYRCLTLHFEICRLQPPALPGLLTWSGADREWTVLCHAHQGELHADATATGAKIVQEWVPTLDEILVARLGKATLAAKED